VARTAHFNGVQKVVFANGPSAANFFLAEKHRHMPSAGRAQDSGSTGMVTGKQKGGQGGGKDEHGSSGPQKKAVGMGEDDNPKGELVDELRKVRRWVTYVTYSTHVYQVIYLLTTYAMYSRLCACASCLHFCTCIYLLVLVRLRANHL